MTARRARVMSLVPLMLLGLLVPVASRRDRPTERRSVELTGADIPKCFAPFLGIRAKYHVDASAVWGFGTHAVDQSTADVSAIFFVSTQLLGAGPHWIHTIEVTKVWRRKSYASHGSSQTETDLPAYFTNLRIHIVQKECDRLGDIMHGPEVLADAREFARGLTDMALALRLPENFDAMLPVRGQRGTDSARLTVRRMSDQRKHITQVRRLVNESKAPIHVKNNGHMISVPLRDELS